MEDLGLLIYKLINFFHRTFCSAIKRNVKIKYLETQEKAIRRLLNHILFCSNKTVSQ